METQTIEQVLREALENKLIVRAYLVYLPVVIGLTLFVSRILFRNGKVFLLDIFNGREDISNSTSRLLEVGFYLLNIGFALLVMKIGTGSYDPMDTNREFTEVLSYKIGRFAIYLGVMLFFNLYLFFGKKKIARKPHAC